MKARIKKILKISLLDLYEIYRDKKIRKKQRKKQKEIFGFYSNKHNEKKLQIGCGSNLLPGWLNTDFNDQNAEVAFLDAGDVFPLESESFDYVYSEHLFEHLDINQQINMLKESWRILKPNGILRIATPSLEFLFNIYSSPNLCANKKYVEWYMLNSPYLGPANELVLNKSYHYCYVINNFFKAWGHKMIHNVESLKSLAIQSGFSDIKEVEVGASEHKSLVNIEKHGAIIPADFNVQETMVLEFKK